MTAPPDLLDSVLAAFPKDLELVSVSTGGFALAILDTGTAGSFAGVLYSGTREGITRAARMYERMRQDMRNGPQRCACGANYARHAWDERSASRRGACPERPGRYEPEEAHHG